MPYPSDPNAAKLLAHIQRMLPDLPRILGADWPDFERRLQALLRQLDQPAVIPVVVEAQVLDLFAPYPRVMKSWRDTTLRGRGGEVTERGSAGAWVQETFQPAQSAQPAAESVTRYTDLRCPGQVSLGREFQVTVRLTLRPHAESRDAQQLSVLTRAPVVVEVDAPAFSLTEGNTRSITVPDDRDSDWAVIGLKALTSGPAEVRLCFWQGGSFLGQARCDVLVVEQPVTAQMQRLPALPLVFGANATPPKRILCISLRDSHLCFSLYADGAPVEIALPPIPFDHNSARYTRRLYAQLSQLAQRASRYAPDLREATAEVEQVGHLLWSDLIPPNLKRLWLEERADWAANSLLLVSDEPYIPWELVWPNEPDIAAPWGSHGPMSRWLGVDVMHPARSGPVERLSTSAWAALFPADSDLSHLADEAALLRRLLPRQGNAHPSSIRRRDVLALLAEGECTWLHAGTHGLLDPAGEAEGVSLRLEGEETLEPEVLLRTAVKTALAQHQPGVFWNICHGAAAGWSLTGVGGWAGRLIDGGASLFLAPQWTVTDKAALLFAETFYSGLTASGDAPRPGVAAAVQQARLAAREFIGDPSWLAYALYAHPCATAA